MFVSGNKYHQLVYEMMLRSKAVDIAVAFLGEGAAELIATAGSARVICNLESGATNPAVVWALRENPAVKIRTLADLHAKVVIAEDAALVGSANFSANGLGFEEREIARWKEAGILVSDFSDLVDARNWFSDLWEGW